MMKKNEKSQEVYKIYLARYSQASWATNTREEANITNSSSSVMMILSGIVKYRSQMKYYCIQKLRILQVYFQLDWKGMDAERDERLLHPELKEYFRKVFGITGVHPVFVDHYELVVLMLDDRGIMFRWNEMEHGMDYMGRKVLRITFIIRRICVIVESTRELII
ncbi:hypothetical protein GLOIN_2v1484956 [Rhizophagus irregularis DAOM 181602=DAOM 197198]|uniref:Uncharacterized protein n=1 Tax=Rhizophagus irregularis (strain DAOM 181602 / DAOM 197198 / MUCL 43194) TaxID=747089 RepID=A0A2P4PCH7_RHIID|nr:hypothetical protein GLOIN_2v1484956 [Rhizophagus irregularis DAOM 181602=DAOM 197198]POG63091.1 hypothetical protein GLOIN_2v1484956 [Rhizophagus irregularis DAOM 181602=DAOM 197198]|eukprot:XP_025169957.1 hypothetical protein GLOIN_2v1484956 [Rhizophagus irregularis DAOM 181602=DAOM 197198]